MLTIKATVTTEAELAVEYNRNAGKLRIATVDTDETVALFTDGAIYRVTAEAPEGWVIINNSTKLPSIVGDLSRAGIIRLDRNRAVYDRFDENTYRFAEVLI